MLTRRCLVLMICIIVLLAISPTAWGDIAKPPGQKLEKKEPGTFQLDTGMQALKRAPWPTEYGRADRALCSDLKGPGATVDVWLGIDLFALFPLGYNRDGYEFEGIRVGPGNILYLHGYTEGKSTLYAYSHEKNLIWDAPIKSRSNFCLDTMGRVYTLEAYGQASESRYEVVCRASDGSILWNYRFGPSLTIDILTVGKHVYVQDHTNQEFFINAINLDGTEAWSKGPYTPWMWPKAAADKQGNLFLKFNTRSMGVWKFDENGNIAWKMPLNRHDATPLASSGSEQVGLICVDDHRLWVDDLEHHFTAGNFDADPYMVINEDGSIYKTGGLGVTIDSSIGCYGSDGRLYIADFENAVACFNNYDESVWLTQLPAGNIDKSGKITNMVLDNENYIYLIYRYGDTRVLYILDPSDGELLDGETLQLSTNAGLKDYLAIGDDEKLIWFNDKGYLKVFEYVEEPLPISVNEDGLQIRKKVIKKSD